MSTEFAVQTPPRGAPGLRARVIAFGATAAAIVGLFLLALLASGSLAEGLDAPRAWLFAGLAALAAASEAAVAPAVEARAPRSESGSRTAPVLGAASAALFLAFSLTSLLLPLRTGGFRAVLGAPWDMVAGAGLMWAGGGLRVAAIATLGARFNSDNHIAAEASLHTDGVFRRLAHPSELGLLLLIAGAMLLTGLSPAWLLAVPIYLLAVLRLRLEEAALLRVHGAAYRLYRSRTLDPLPSLLFMTGGTPQ